MGIGTKFLTFLNFLTTTLFIKLLFLKTEFFKSNKKVSHLCLKNLNAEMPYQVSCFGNQFFLEHNKMKKVCSQENILVLKRDKLYPLKLFSLELPFRVRRRLILQKVTTTVNVMSVPIRP